MLLKKSRGRLLFFVAVSNNGRYELDLKMLLLYNNSVIYDAISNIYGGYYI